MERTAVCKPESAPGRNRVAARVPAQGGGLERGRADSASRKRGDVGVLPDNTPRPRPRRVGDRPCRSDKRRDRGARRARIQSASARQLRSAEVMRREADCPIPRPRGRESPVGSDSPADSLPNSRLVSRRGSLREPPASSSARLRVPLPEPLASVPAQPRAPLPEPLASVPARARRLLE